MAIHTEIIEVPGYEKVVFGEDVKSGMQSIIAIHSTTLGPACGGIRMLPYAKREEALEDVLRLAKGMSYKSALAGIGFGGGKSVLIGDPTKKTTELFLSFGQFVDSFGGQYLAAKDMNITGRDLFDVKRATRFVLGIDGAPGSSGDPSPVTARGIFRAMEATMDELTGSRSLNGSRIALQGIGHVGFAVAEAVKKAGGKIWVCDVSPETLERAKKELGATVVGLDEIYDVPCEIFSPSARGAILNKKNLPRLKCKAVVGCANNQLETPEDGYWLAKQGILYAPDFAVNSGGIINIFIEYEGYNADKALKKADAIYDTVKEIYRRSKTENLPPFLIADRLAEERIYENKA